MPDPNPHVETARASLRSGPFIIPAQETRDEMAKRRHRMRALKSSWKAKIAKGVLPATILDELERAMDEALPNWDAARSQAAKKKSTKTAHVRTKKGPNTRAKETPDREKAETPTESGKDEATTKKEEVKPTAPRRADDEPRPAKTPTMVPRLNRKSPKRAEEYPDIPDDEDTRANRILMLQLLHECEPPTQLPSTITWHVARNPEHCGTVVGALLSELHGKALDGTLSDGEAEEELLKGMPAASVLTTALTTILEAAEATPIPLDANALINLGAHLLHAAYPLLIQEQAASLIRLRRTDEPASTTQEWAESCHRHAVLVHWRELRRADSDNIHELPETITARIHELTKR